MCEQFVVRNNLINQKANSADPDQMAWMCWLIWIYTVHPCYKGIAVPSASALVVF
jgi:hypothetical protein